jgi:hypothetical protein
MSVYSKKEITKEEMIELMNQFEIIHPLPIHLSKEEAAKEILTELTNNKEAKSILLHELISTILTNKEIFDSKYKDFYYHLLQYYISPSQQIKAILEKVKNRLNNEKDKNLIQSLDWVISTLTNTDIFDFHIKNDFINNKISSLNDNNNDYVKFLTNYSNEKQKQISVNQYKNFKKIKTLRHFSSINLNLGAESNLLNHYMSSINSIRNIDFDIFEFKKEFNLNNHDLMNIISTQIFDSFGLFEDEIVDNSKFAGFIKTVANQYNNNPYHNAIHATDVLQTTSIILLKGDVKDKKVFDDFEIASMLIAGIIHDLGHPGTSNLYQINKGTKLALKYNDRSPLENMHCYKGFKILMKNEYNILCNLNIIEFKMVRLHMIDMILNTDGSNHSTLLLKIKEKIEKVNSIKSKLVENLKEKKKNKKSENTNENENDSQDKEILECDYDNLLVLYSIAFNDNDQEKLEAKKALMSFILHLADISNPAKKFVIYKEWEDRVCQEFFKEGDIEKKEGLPVTFLCDRETTKVPRSQINFINFVVMPGFNILVTLFTECKDYVSNCENNINEWKKIEEEDEKKKKEEEEKNKNILKIF